METQVCMDLTKYNTVWDALVGEAPRLAINSERCRVPADMPNYSLLSFDKDEAKKKGKIVKGRKNK